MMRFSEIKRLEQLRARYGSGQHLSGEELRELHTLEQLSLENKKHKQVTCPVCLESKRQEELDMFNGVCEDCAYI